MISILIGSCFCRKESDMVGYIWENSILLNILFWDRNIKKKMKKFDYCSYFEKLLYFFSSIIVLYINFIFLF